MALIRVRQRIIGRIQATNARLRYAILEAEVFMAYFVNASTAVNSTQHGKSCGKVRIRSEDFRVIIQVLFRIRCDKKMA